MKPARNSKYIKFVRALGGKCCLCPAPAVEPHHFGWSGMGMKGSDYRVARVCRSCHESIQGKYKIAFIRERKEWTYCLLLEDALDLVEEYEESRRHKK